MTEEEKKLDNAAPVSEEQPVVDSGEQAAEPQEKSVPLSALEAERRKRQEAEARNRAYEEHLAKVQAQKEKPEDDEEWVSRGEVKKTKQLTKQEILEEVYVESNPEKMNEINTYLEKIVERKPWLAQTIATAPNRYARAYEVVQDYKHLVAQQKQNAAEAKKIVENAQKPRSPVTVSKGSNQSQSDYLLSIRGTPDFKKYRQEVMQGRR